MTEADILARDKAFMLKPPFEVLPPRRWISRMPPEEWLKKKIHEETNGEKEYSWGWKLLGGIAYPVIEKNGSQGLGHASAHFTSDMTPEQIFECKQKFLEIERKHNAGAL